MKNLRYKNRVSTATWAIQYRNLRFPSFSVTMVALAFLIGCASSKIPTLYDTNPVLGSKQYAAEEMAKIEQNFNEDPKQYAQEMGNLILWRMNIKNSEFARKFAQTPELREGLDEKKVKAMVTIYNLIKDQEFPANLFADERQDARAPTDLSKELLVLKNMVSAGKGDRRFSAPLQALLWGYMDGYFREGDKPLENYRGPLNFVKPIWGKMEGPRWEDFETVTSRLNLPELVDYYELTNFKYVYSSTRGEDILAVAIFKDKKGSCGHYASFAKYCLRKAGYDAAGLRFRWGGEKEAHHIVIYTENGKYYSLDRARKRRGILGPFDSVAGVLKANQEGPTWDIRFW